MGSWGKDSIHGESDNKNESKYLDRMMMGFWSKGQVSNQDT